MLNEKQIKQWSQIGMRATFGQVLFDIAQQNKDIMVITADLGITSGLSHYMEMLPEQFLNVGIAEQNMVGIATGLSLKGYRVYATSFAPFATARCCEQIRVNLGEMKVPVTIVGIASGFEIEQFGNSHYGFDDISFMRAISGLTILSPADTTELAQMLEKIVEYNKPVYLRMTKTTRKGLVYKQDFDYEIGKANIIKDMGDITIIATGSMVSTALIVAQRMESEKQLSCGVIDLHTIKPIDRICIEAANKRSKLLVTLEEHNRIGGIGSAVAEICATTEGKARLHFIGIDDEHRYVGDYNYLMRAYGLDKHSVFENISNAWDSVNGEI